MLTVELKKMKKNYIDGEQKNGSKSVFYYDQTNVGDKHAHSNLLLRKRLEEALQQKITKSKSKDKSKIQLTAAQHERVRKQVQKLIRQTEPTEGREVIIKKDKQGNH